jgi:hypothetical protein
MEAEASVPAGSAAWTNLVMTAERFIENPDEDR